MVFGTAHIDLGVHPAYIGHQILHLIHFFHRDLPPTGLKTIIKPAKVLKDIHFIQLYDPKDHSVKSLMKKKNASFIVANYFPNAVAEKKIEAAHHKKGERKGQIDLLGKVWASQ
jgi:hypothetical protein